MYRCMPLPCLLVLSHCWRYTNVQVHAMCISCLLDMSDLWRYNCTCVPCALPCLLAVSHCWRYKCTCVPCALPRLYVIPWNVQMCMCAMPVAILDNCCHTAEGTFIHVHVCHIHCWSINVYVPCTSPCLTVVVTQTADVHACVPGQCIDLCILITVCVLYGHHKAELYSVVALLK